MEVEAVDRIREAYEALVERNPVQLVSLLDPEVHWRGVQRRRPWDKSSPF